MSYIDTWNDLDRTSTSPLKKEEQFTRPDRNSVQTRNGTTSSQNRNAINGVDCVEGKIVYSLNGSLDLNNITMILCNYSINTITIINCEWNDWMVLSYKSVSKHVIVIKRCTNNGDCPRDKPIGLNRFCIGNKEYRKYTYTKTLDIYMIL